MKFETHDWGGSWKNKNNYLVQFTGFFSACFKEDFNIPFTLSINFYLFLHFLIDIMFAKWIKHMHALSYLELYLVFMHLMTSFPACVPTWKTEDCVREVYLLCQYEVTSNHSEWNSSECNTVELFQAHPLTSSLFHYLWNDTWTNLKRLRRQRQNPLQKNPIWENKISLLRYERNKHLESNWIMLWSGTVYGWREELRVNFF